MTAEQSAELLQLSENARCKAEGVVRAQLSALAHWRREFDRGAGTIVRLTQELAEARRADGIVQQTLCASEAEVIRLAQVIWEMSKREVALEKKVSNLEEELRILKCQEQSKST